jgi:glycine reductase complex component B subunit alpha and beta
MRLECRHEPLSLAEFDVKEVLDGVATSWAENRLVVDLGELTECAREVAPALADVVIRLVRPGDSVRIANVLDAIVPAVKAVGPEATFPGVLGPLSLAGRGRTNRLRGVAVLSVCDWQAAGYTSAEEFPDSYVDMDGPGRSMTAWGERAGLVVICTPTPGAALIDVDRSVRRAAMRVARETALATFDEMPSSEAPCEISRYVDPGLQSVAVILQVASEGPLVDTFLYGGAVQGIAPTVIDYCEILDGALTAGAYDWPAVRNTTACYQDSALIRSLVAQHGKTLRFAGVILALGYLDTAFEKERSAMLSARLAQLIGADGVICTTFSSGNSHTDTMLTVRACEALGVASVAIVAETNGGLTDHVPGADAIISTGNESELVDAWLPDEVIGASSAMAGKPVPLWSYLGACGQTGDMALTAASV